MSRDQWRRMIVLLYPFLFSFAIGCHSQSGKEPYWIGHVLPLSAGNRESGEQAINALRLELDNTENSEPTDGLRRFGIRHADGSTTEKARAETIRLLSVNRVKALILGPGLNDVDKVLASIRPATGPVLVLDELLEETTREGIMVLGSNSAERGRTLARLLMKQGKLPFLVVDRADSRSCKVTEAFQETWATKMGSLQAYDLPASNLVELIQSSSRPMNSVVVVLCIPAAKIGGVLVQIKGLSLDIPLIFGFEADNLTLPSLKREVSWVSIFASPNRWPESGRTWADAYQKRFKQPPTRHSMLAADAIRWLQQLGTKLDKEGGATFPTKSINEESFESLTGVMTWSGNLPRRPLFLHRVRSGKTEVTSIVPEGSP